MQELVSLEQVEHSTNQTEKQNKTERPRIVVVGTAVDTAVVDTVAVVVAAAVVVVVVDTDIVVVVAAVAQVVDTVVDIAAVEARAQVHHQTD